MNLGGLAAPVRVLVASRSDAASVNIRDRLLEAGEWELTGTRFRGAVVWGRSEAVLLEIEGPAVHDEALEADLSATGWPIMDVWFLSRHRAESGMPSLTVHPIGNHGPVAQLGGRPASLAPAASRDMGALLRRLKHHSSAEGLPHEITYEATHHGPGMRFPALFLEIGSSDEWYTDRRSAQVVARAVDDVLAGGGKCSGPLLISAGGGHYVPRATDIALAGRADFGHFLPAYALAAADRETLARAVAATPGVAALHVHKKGLKGPERQKVMAWASELGLQVWDGGSE